MPFILGVKAIKEHEKTIPIAHPDRSIIRPKLEYPTVDINFTYLAVIGKLERYVEEGIDPGRPKLITTDIFINKAIESFTYGNFSHFVARFHDSRNTYYLCQNSAHATADFRLLKVVKGVTTLIGQEAIDFGTNATFTVKFRCIGATIEGYREDMIVPRISVTDTALANGRFGFVQDAERPGYFIPEQVYLRGSPSASLGILAYFEVSIIGSGKEDDPFRAKLPEKIIEDKTFGRRNFLSVSHSSLIPTDTKGQPRNTTTLVRVFAQPDKDPALAPIDICLKEIEVLTGVKKLIKAHAIKRAKGMDPILTNYDLLSHPNPTKGDIEGFIKHKEKTFKIKLTEEEAIEELRHDKAW